MDNDKAIEKLNSLANIIRKVNPESELLSQYGWKGTDLSLIEFAIPRIKAGYLSSKFFNDCNLVYKRLSADVKKG